MTIALHSAARLNVTAVQRPNIFARAAGYILSEIMRWIGAY